MPPKHEDFALRRHKIWQAFNAIQTAIKDINTLADQALEYPQPEINMDEHIRIGYFIEGFQELCSSSEDFFGNFYIEGED